MELIWVEIATTDKKLLKLKSENDISDLEEILKRAAQRAAIPYQYLNAISVTQDMSKWNPNEINYQWKYKKNENLDPMKIRNSIPPNYTLKNGKVIDTIKIVEEEEDFRMEIYLKVIHHLQFL